MSDTPETDHLEVQLGQAAMHSHPILWEHGRRMERERDGARKLADEFHKDQTRLILERHKAREEIAELQGVIKALKATMRDNEKISTLE